MIELDANFNHQAYEKKWYDHSLKHKYFRALSDPSKIPFTILMPPPNVTGVLHVGHALTIALDGLRDRPLRPTAAAAPTNCPCSTGAGLCKQDAEFLTRESARADDHRTGLEACYEFADKVK